jgi:ribosomal subunit interface protein
MDILIHTEGFTITESVKSLVEHKIGRVEQYAPRAVRARVRFRKVSAHPSPKQFVVRVLFELPGKHISAEEPGPDPVSALDVVSEKIERRLRKLKTARLDRRTHKTPRVADVESEPLRRRRRRN